MIRRKIGGLTQWKAAAKFSCACAVPGLVGRAWAMLPVTQRLCGSAVSTWRSFSADCGVGCGVGRGRVIEDVL
jgi:hypothetical protein